MYALFCCIYKTSKTKQKILWITFPYQSIRKVTQILAERKAKCEGGYLLFVILSAARSADGLRDLRCGQDDSIVTIAI